MRTLAEMARPLKSRPAGKPHLILMTDESRQHDPIPLAARLPAGSLVLLRHYDSPDRRALATRLARLCRIRRLTLVIGADFHLAAALGAGLHLPEGLARCAPAKIRLWHRRRGTWLSCAAHSRGALVHARRQKSDAALLSPVFPTASHPGGKTLGPLTFRRLSRLFPGAVYALGGVNVSTLFQLRGSRAAGIASVAGWERPATDRVR